MSEHVGRPGFFCLNCNQQEFMNFQALKIHLAEKHGMDSSHGKFMQTVDELTAGVVRNVMGEAQGIESSDGQGIETVDSLTLGTEEGENDTV